MLAAIAESAVVAWPLAITLASVVVADRVRRRRHHELLNRALHELRRPLQALVLTRTRSRPGPPRGDHLGLALEALAELDRELNGLVARTPEEVVEALALAAEAVRRWRAPAATEGRDIELAWHAAGCRLVCDPVAVARALDNLIANSLEHGSGPIRVEGSVRAQRLRMLVADGADAGGLAIPRVSGSRPRGWLGGAGERERRDARRGHGLAIVAEIAADHGGRFAACAHAAGSSAVLELPLAEARAPSLAG